MCYELVAEVETSHHCRSEFITTIKKIDTFDPLYLESAPYPVRAKLLQTPTHPEAGSERRGGAEGKLR